VKNATVYTPPITRGAYGLGKGVFEGVRSSKGQGLDVTIPAIGKAVKTNMVYKLLRK
jgi:hypothetical protein